MGEIDERMVHLIGREYLSTSRGLVGTLVRPVQYRRMSHFWLDLGDVCTLVPVMGTAAAHVFLPEEVAACRKRSRRFAKMAQRWANE
jgi:hypothetical protein